MTWQSRLLSLVAAGGLATVSACSSSSPRDLPRCNANPDPCCSDPEGEACKQYKIDSGRPFLDDAPVESGDAPDASDAPDATPADAADASAKGD